MTEQSLFSLEILIDSIDSLQIHCALPAISFRFLDFPINTIHQLDPQAIDELKQQYSPDQLTSPSLPRDIERKVRNHDGSYTINRGKSCLFKMALKDLYQHLSNSPLCLMVIDAWQKTPKLVGSTLVSLHQCMETIYTKASKLDINIPIITGEKGTFPIHNLMGAKIGMMSLKYKLLSLGKSLLPHVTNHPLTENQQHLSLQTEVNQAVESLVNTIDNSDQEQVLPPKPSKQTAETQTESTKLKPKKHIKLHKKFNQEDNDNNKVSGYANVFCPAPLYYNSLADEQGSETQAFGYESENSDSYTFTLPHVDVDSVSGSGSQSQIVEDQEKIFAVKNINASHRVHSQDLSLPSNTQLDEKLKQFPLLNALLSEILDLVREVDDARDDNSTTTNPSLLSHNDSETNEINSRHSQDKRKSRKGSTLKFRSTKTQRLRFAKLKENKQTAKTSNSTTNNPIVSNTIIEEEVTDNKDTKPNGYHPHPNLTMPTVKERQKSRVSRSSSNSESNINLSDPVLVSDSNSESLKDLQQMKDNDIDRKSNVTEEPIPLPNNDPGFPLESQVEDSNLFSDRNSKSSVDMYSLTNPSNVGDEPDLVPYHDANSFAEIQDSPESHGEEPDLKPYDDSKLLEYAKDYLSAIKDKEIDTKTEKESIAKRTDKSSSNYSSDQPSLLSEHEKYSYKDPKLSTSENLGSNDKSDDEYSQDFEDEHSDEETSYRSDFDATDEGSRTE